jgi:co-chaperonin GroES (HSP10)
MKNGHKQIGMILFIVFALVLIELIAGCRGKHSKIQSMELSEQAKDSRAGDDLKSLNEYKTHLVSIQPIVFEIAKLSINGSLATYLAEYEYSHLGGFPIIEFGEGNERFSAFSSNYIHSYSEVKLGKLKKEQFEALKSEYWPQNHLRFDSEMEYSLQAFLPPVMQALMNRRGFFMNLIDCYSTAYGLKVHSETPQINGGLINHDLKAALEKAGAIKVGAVRSGNSVDRYQEIRPKLQFGDIILLNNHASTVLSKDLVFEKINAGTASFHLTSFDYFATGWDGEAQVYRLPKGTYLPSLDKISIPQRGNIPSMTVPVKVVEIEKTSSGIFAPKKAKEIAN